MRNNGMGEKEMQDRLFSDRQLIKLMIPLVIEQGLTILVGMCDGVMVSAVSEAAISGVSLVDMINAVILVLFAALATGAYASARSRERCGSATIPAQSFSFFAGRRACVFDGYHGFQLIPSENRYHELLQP